MKESPRRYTNPFLSDEENEKLNLWTQELDDSNIHDDNTINPLQPSEFCEKETELFTDKNVLECEFPELLICYKEDAFHVKDICVDENSNEMLNPEQLKFSTTEDYYLESNVKVDIGLPVLEPSNLDEVTETKSDAFCGTREVDAELHLDGPINDHNNTCNISIETVTPAQDLQDSVPDHKDSNDGNGNSKSAPDGFMVSSEAVIVSKATDDNVSDMLLQSDEEKISSSDDLLDNVITEKAVSNSGPTLVQDRVLPSLQSLLESIDQQACQNPLEEISKSPDEGENNTLNLNKTEPATSIENLERVTEVSIEPNGAPKVQDTGSDNVATVNRGELESSFSVAGHAPEHITYSGPMVFSGNTSLRSESSTTSTRSFAFPILQNEWNSSPVRMAKADRRRLQKHRGWKHGLLCCRF
ncbi:uncharacterized protein LOC143573239 [Bidens hawaiensis]|uniref:uncharacterized protein LOC143573239 n=1 Tax=Bidens hawaiensis TaxID=980011 RepID=UPI00404AF21A